MTLSAKEEQLVEAFRKLPTEAAENVAELVERLAAQTPGTRVDWSDEWSEEDRHDYGAAFLARIASAERERDRCSAATSS
jgi:hypothetical protein